MTPRLLVALTFPLLLAAGLGMGGCSALAPTPAVPDSSAAEAFPRPADGEFSVMTFNLHQYALQDAAAESEGSAPKPRPGTDARGQERQGRNSMNRRMLLAGAGALASALEKARR